MDYINVTALSEIITEVLCRSQQYSTIVLFKTFKVILYNYLS
jgi:hypothetical protein